MKKIIIRKLKDFNDWFIDMEDKQDCFMTTDNFIAPMHYPVEISFEIKDEPNGHHKKTCIYNIKNIYHENHKKID